MMDNDLRLANVAVAASLRFLATSLEAQGRLLLGNAASYRETADRLESGDLVADDIPTLKLVPDEPEPPEPAGPELVERVRRLNFEKEGEGGPGQLVRERDSLLVSPAMTAWLDAFHADRRNDVRFPDAVNAAAGVPIGPEATDIVMTYLRDVDIVAGGPTCDFETPEGNCKLDAGHEGRHDPDPERS